MLPEQATNEAQWRDAWSAMLAEAKRRPPLYIGGWDMAHYYLEQPLRLVWTAKAFRRPCSAFVSLSPHQYVVQCMTGPLLRPIQQIFSWESKRILNDGWHKQHSRLVDVLTNYKFQKVFPSSSIQSRPRGWSRYFGSSTGPRLDSPMNAFYLAKRFVIGYRVDAGMWCQTFENGWPQSPPFLVTQPSPVGFLAAAELEEEWFRDLPFGEKTRTMLASTPHVDLQWHERDDLLDAASLSHKGVRRWL